MLSIVTQKRPSVEDRDGFLRPVGPGVRLRGES